MNDLQKALAKIKECKELGDSYVNLTGLKITAIPQELLELKWLIVLFICNTLIEDITPLKELEHLVELHVANTPFAKKVIDYEFASTQIYNNLKLSDGKLTIYLHF